MQKPCFCTPFGFALRSGILFGVLKPGVSRQRRLPIYWKRCFDAKAVLLHPVGFALRSGILSGVLKLGVSRQRRLPIFTRNVVSTQKPCFCTPFGFALRSGILSGVLKPGVSRQRRLSNYSKRCFDAKAVLLHSSWICATFWYFVWSAKAGR
jgi:hypothetical protein